MGRGWKFPASEAGRLVGCQDLEAWPVFSPSGKGQVVQGLGVALRDWNSGGL